MLITIAAAAMVMAAYFLLLYGGVGFIQDKRFFGSAHKDVLAVIPDKKPERFRGAHIVGGVIIAVSFLLFAGALVLSVWDGVRNGFSFWGILRQVHCGALCHGDLRYFVLRLVSALPFELLPVLLS